MMSNLHNYPPVRLTTSDNVFNILQLTDTHLYQDKEQLTAGINNHNSFLACLDQALNQDKRCDLILVTGDIVNEVKSEIYDRVFRVLEGTGIPFACIAGNHDVTDEIQSGSSYEQRQYIAHEPDGRLLSRHIISANDWKILLIDSSVSGKVYGKVGNHNLQWLNQTIVNCHCPVIIAMHHHVLPMNSDWIDNHICKDAEDFWHVISQYPQVKAVISGHVHQHFEGHCNSVKFLTSPSTCYQFKPKQDKFELDDSADPGYRWLTLKSDSRISNSCTTNSLITNSHIESWIERLNQ